MQFCCSGWEGAQKRVAHGVVAFTKHGRTGQVVIYNIYPTLHNAINFWKISSCHFSMTMIEAKWRVRSGDGDNHG